MRVLFKTNYLAENPPYTNLILILQLTHFLGMKQLCSKSQQEQKACK